jgi:hypothetical protein
MTFILGALVTLCSIIAMERCLPETRDKSAVP